MLTTCDDCGSDMIVFECTDGDVVEKTLCYTCSGDASVTSTC